MEIGEISSYKLRVTSYETIRVKFRIKNLKTKLTSTPPLRGGWEGLHMKHTYLLIISLSLLLSACNATIPEDKIQWNDGWLFQRLEKQVEQTIQKSKGSSWDAQFNIVHTAQSANLKVSRDTLQAEFNQLQSANWEKVTLPHSAKIEKLTVLQQWQGLCYYKKTLVYNPAWDGKRIWLEFEGAMHLADVWVNGKHITQHAGGYTPFVIDLTPLLYRDKENEILVRLDNRDNPLIPPGKPVKELDFYYYGGIYRNVNILLKPQDAYVSHPIMAGEAAGGGIFVTYPHVSKTSAEVKVQTHVVNGSTQEKELIVRQRLFELNKRKKGREVVKSEEQLRLKADESVHQIQKMLVTNPKLWSTDAPNLYLLETEISEGGKVINSQTTRIGIRHIEFTKEKGFYLNGKPLRLVGSNRHMEYPYVGNALSDNAQYRDIYQIKESGFNIVRLGHYPQAKSVLDACDELGLLAIEPIPGWQFYNEDSTFINLTFRDVRDLIRRDRNHPSIVMWETTLNEAWPPDSWKDEAVRVAHAEYPGDQFYTSGDGYGYHGFDVVYNDWKEGYHRPTPGPQAGFIREYYDFEFGGHNSTTRVKRGDGEKAQLQNSWNAQWSHNRYWKQYPATSGDAVWSMYDYNRGYSDNICGSGVADIFRLPKFSFDFYFSQLSVGTPLPSGAMKPFLFIANYWTARSTDDDTVIVYGNVDEVELKVNGQVIARQQQDNGADTDYTKTADGGNCRNLAFPPFTFRNIHWECGQLEAVGYINGKKVVSQQRLTPEQPQKLRISYFESGQKAGRNDLLIVYVELLDKNGTLCVESSGLVNISVSNGSQVIGPKEINAEAGIASFLVQTGNVNKLEIEAKAESGIGQHKTIDIE